MEEERWVTLLLHEKASRDKGESFLTVRPPCDAAQGDPFSKSQILSRREAIVTHV